MSPTIIAVADFDMVVFGATGDLTLRKLLPALYHRFADKQFSAACRIIAAARSDLTDDTYRGRAEKALREHVPAADLADDMLGRIPRAGYSTPVSTVPSRMAGNSSTGLLRGRAGPDAGVLSGDLAGPLRRRVQEPGSARSW